MRRIGLLAVLAPLGLLLVSGACAPAGAPPEGSPSMPERGGPPESVETPNHEPGASPAVSHDQVSSPLTEVGAIDVAPGSALSLGLRGGTAPMIADQTITSAVVVLEDIQMVSSEGTAITLLDDQV